MSRVFAAAGLRSFTAGLVAVLLGLHVAALGYGAEALGLVAGLGLAGNAVATAVVALVADRFGRRRTLVGTSWLSAAGLVAFAVTSSPLILAAAAFLGMLNGMGRDRGPAQTLDQAMLADRTTDVRRTAAFVRYTLAQDVAGMLGSLAAGAPALLQAAWKLSPLAAYRWMFAAGAVAAVLQAILYAGLAPSAESAATREGRRGRAALSGETRRRLAGLSALFGLDSLGGGFLAGSILSYWFFRRFELGAAAIGGIFFAARLLNAASYPAAGALARRIGLVRTMVVTHLPSSLLLFALPVVGSPTLAIAVFLAREALVQMDVPTRQSYVAAVVLPAERTFALGVTSLVRNVGWAAGPVLSGLAIAWFGLAAPLLVGGVLKTAYDVALYRSYRDVRAPEEAKQAPGPPGASGPP